MRLNTPVRVRRRLDKGATTVIVAILAVTLLGMAAISVDFASASAKRQNLQSAADAAALAIANDCAKSTAVVCTSGASATATWYATKAGATVVSSTPDTTNTKVTVTLKASDLGTGLSQSTFGKGATAQVKATAKWTAGTVSAVKSLSVPLAFEYCSWKANKASTADQNYTYKLLPLPSLSTPSPTNCSDPMQPTKTVYNLDAPHNNQATILNTDLLGWSSACDIPSGDKISVWRVLAQNVINIAFTINSGCKSKFAALTKGQTILVPIYASYKPFTSSSTWGEVRIVGFAPFQIASSNPFNSVVKIFGIGVDNNSDTCNLGISLLLDTIQTGCTRIRGHWINVASPMSKAEYAAEVAGIKIPVDSATAGTAKLIS